MSFQWRVLEPSMELPLPGAPPIEDPGGSREDFHPTSLRHLSTARGPRVDSPRLRSTILKHIATRPAVFYFAPLPSWSRCSPLRRLHFLYFLILLSLYLPWLPGKASSALPAQQPHQAPYNSPGLH